MITTNKSLFFNQKQKKKSLIAIDYGTRKLGCAVSDPRHSYSLPFKTILCSKNTAIDEQTSILEKNIDFTKFWGIVIGLPLNIDGTENINTETVSSFAKSLQNSLKLPILLADERLTSREADNILQSMGMRRKERNSKDDMISACLILNYALDGSEGGT